MSIQNCQTHMSEKMPVNYKRQGKCLATKFLCAFTIVSHFFVETDHVFAFVEQTFSTGLSTWLVYSLARWPADWPADSPYASDAVYLRFAYRFS